MKRIKYKVIHCTVEERDNGKEHYESFDTEKEAIKRAVKSAGQDDTVIITGKGSEPWMCVKNGKKIPWDDRQIARDVLAEKNLTRGL